jgi:[ribosomal protein S5]-alanine N-acetyltransferase
MSGQRSDFSTSYCENLTSSPNCGSLTFRNLLRNGFSVRALFVDSEKILKCKNERQEFHIRNDDMTTPQELRTRRLLLRSIERGDIPAIVCLAGAREIATTTAKIPHPYTENDAQSFLAHAEEDFREGRSVTFVVTILPGGELCGAVGLVITPEHERAELGYWMGVPYWGQGFATEAATAVVAFGFETLRLNRIHASHFVGNTASQRVLEKIGMRHEGTTRLRVRKWNQSIEVEIYGLLASEFRGAKPST